MLEHDMSVEVRANRLTFNAELRRNFKAVELDIPKFKDVRERGEFKDAAREKVRDACGIGSCRAAVFVDFLPFPKSYVEGGTIACGNAECPLNDGGGSGVREPLAPTGPGPTTTEAEMSRSS